MIMMDTNEYCQQLQAINQILENCTEGPERDELLSLKQSIEELLSLTNEVEKNVKQTSMKDESITISKEVKKEGSGEGSTEIDNEYALFMAEMAKEGAVEINENKSTIGSKNISNRLDRKSSENFKHLEGKKVRAPHKHSWGQVVYHNAMICSLPDEIPANKEFEVKVLFLNPTHKEMQPCPYYFHLEKDCRYSEEMCNFSHGELVPYYSLQKYIEPKFEHLTIGSDVLAKEKDNLWHRAKIAQILTHEDKCLVKFVDNNSFEKIVFAHILPLERSGNASDNSSDSDSDVEAIGEDFEKQLENDCLDAKRRREQLINKSLMHISESQKLGDWEKYTKGIGSKLMQKMGYIVGTGLGKEGSGILKPVSAIVLPPGKSLDYCMRLKEEENNPNLFDADYRVSKRHKHLKEKKAKRRAQVLMKFEQMGIVKFLKSRYSFQRFPWTQTDEKEFELMREKLKAGSDKDINTANYMVDEKIKKWKMSIEKLKIEVRRLEELHSDTTRHYRLIRNKESDLKNLKAHKMMITNEMDRRKNNKEMAVF